MTQQSKTPIGIRIIYAGGRPVHWTGRDRDFGLQDKDEVLHRGTADADGRVTFDLSVEVKFGPNGSPVFLGPFTHGTAANRFLYLSWRNADGPYAMRFKLPLGAISADLIERAIRTGQPIIGELTIPAQRATTTGVNIGGTRDVVWT